MDKITETENELIDSQLFLESIQDISTSLVKFDPFRLQQNSIRADGRLTVTSGTPVTTSGTDTGSTLYYTPYKGNGIAVKTGAGVGTWSYRTFSELSLSVAGLTANTVYDVFLYDSAGTLTLETLAWASLTGRATNITRTAAGTDGVYFKNGALTRRYLGTIYMDATTGGVLNDTFTSRGIWNNYHRIRRTLKFEEASGAAWNYNSTVARSVNGNTTGNRIYYVIGLNEGCVRLSSAVIAEKNDATARRASQGWDPDGTTAYDGNQLRGAGMRNDFRYQIWGNYINRTSGIGGRFYQWLEDMNNNEQHNFYTDSANDRVRSGATGSLDM